MKEPIRYIDRLTGKVEVEEVYGKKALEFLYGDDLVSQIFGAPVLHALVKYPLFSKLYGFFQDLPASQKKIAPFIEKFGVDTGEFLEPVESYKTFNQFFYRKLKSQSRKIEGEEEAVIIPADGRYLFFPEIDKAEQFFLKRQRFDLRSLLQNDPLFERYRRGVMVLARLCPTDYHRFHFPVSGTASESRLINGYLYSVNPIALRKNINRLTENRRTFCQIETERFGEVLFMEIGATNVGSITQTYDPGTKVSKGDEKGFFSFGGSSIILLFEPGKIQLADDLLELGAGGLEVRALFGQILGRE